MSLRALRLDRNVTQEELAQKIGVSASMISRYEKGTSIPPADKVVQMARFLHTTVDSIMDYRSNVIESNGDPVYRMDSLSAVNADRIAITTSNIDHEVIALANGTCELCGLTFQQPFFLEAHYLVWVRDGGKPTLSNIVALCPNCHKRIHFEQNQEELQALKDKAAKHKLV